MNQIIYKKAFDILDKWEKLVIIPCGIPLKFLASSVSQGIMVPTFLLKDKSVIEIFCYKNNFKKNIKKN